MLSSKLSKKLFHFNCIAIVNKILITSPPKYFLQHKTLYNGKTICQIVTGTSCRPLK